MAGRVSQYFRVAAERSGAAGPRGGEDDVHKSQILLSAGKAADSLKIRCASAIFFFFTRILLYNIMSVCVCVCNTRRYCSGTRILKRARPR